MAKGKGGKRNDIPPGGGFRTWMRRATRISATGCLAVALLATIFDPAGLRAQTAPVWSSNTRELLTHPEIASAPDYDVARNAAAEEEVKLAFRVLMQGVAEEVANEFTRDEVSFDPPALLPEALVGFLPTFVEEIWFAWTFGQSFSSRETAYDTRNLKIRSYPSFKFYASISHHPGNSLIEWVQKAAMAQENAPPPEADDENVLQLQETPVTIGEHEGTIEISLEAESRFLEIHWARDTGEHSVTLKVLAPTPAGKVDYATAIAQRLEDILEAQGFYAFPVGDIAETNAIEFLDANVIYSRDGETLVADRRPSELIRAAETRVGTTADGISQLILRTELDPGQTAAFSLRSPDDGKVEPLLDGRTIELADSFYSFALYTPPDRFDPDGGKQTAPDETSAQPEKRLGEILEVRDVPILLSIDGRAPKRQNLTLARPPVVLVHGLFSDPVHTWINTLAGGQSMTKALETAGFLPFLVNYQATNGAEGSGSWLTEDRGSSFAENRRVVWDSPVVDYRSFRYEYGQPGGEGSFFFEQPKPDGTRLGGIRQALTHFREELDLAATQAIVVGHSMGGLLARVWAFDGYNAEYERPENFFAGDIDRLLTLNTPHHGSELPELKDALGRAGIEGETTLQSARRQLANTALWWMLHPEPGAVRDLRQIGATEIPSFAIGTTASSAQIGNEQTDPFQHYNILYSFAGTIFFNNPALLDSFVESRFLRWRNTAAPFRQSAAHGDRPPIFARQCGRAASLQAHDQRKH